MWLIIKSSTIADSEGGTLLTSLGRGLNSLTLAQHDSMLDGSEAFRPGAGASSNTSDNASRIWAGLKAWNDFTGQSKGDSAVDDGHVWIGQTENKIYDAGTAYTGYDSHGIGHIRHRSPSTAASSQVFGDMSSAESPRYSVSVNISLSLVLTESNVCSLQEPDFPDRQRATITRHRQLRPSRIMVNRITDYTQTITRMTMMTIQIDTSWLKVEHCGIS